MEVYLYCSYANSRRGFVMTRLEERELAPAGLAEATGAGQQMVYRFFTYDVFRALWLEFPESGRLPLLPQADGGMFGIRGLRGEISQRTGVINFALLADRQELERLERMAAGILADPEGFALALCGCLSVGGTCGYQADGQKVWELLEQVAAQPVPAALREYLDRQSQRVYTSRDLLRLAVYTGQWEQAVECLHPKWLWSSRPKQALTQQEAAELLGKPL